MKACSSGVRRRGRRGASIDPLKARQSRDRPRTTPAIAKPPDGPSGGMRRMAKSYDTKVYGRCMMNV
jgi:hypothetical protein